MKPLVAYMHLGCVILSLSFERDSDLEHASWLCLKLAPEREATTFPNRT